MDSGVKWILGFNGCWGSMYAGVQWMLGSTVTVTVIYTFNGDKWMLVINGCWG